MTMTIESPTGHIDRIPTSMEDLEAPNIHTIVLRRSMGHKGVIAAGEMMTPVAETATTDEAPKVDPILGTVTTDKALRRELEAGDLYLRKEYGDTYKLNTPRVEHIPFANKDTVGTLYDPVRPGVPTYPSSDSIKR